MKINIGEIPKILGKYLRNIGEILNNIGEILNNIREILTGFAGLLHDDVVVLVDAADQTHHADCLPESTSSL